MENDKKFYVYVDYREDSGEPFYVGKGNEIRVSDLTRNELHTNIKNKHGIIRKILFETTDEFEAFKKEIQLIQELGTFIGEKNGGANFTLGGEGTSGYERPDDERTRISNSLKKVHENPEIREKIRKSLKKRFEDHELRKERSENVKKLWDNPEYRSRISESNKKKYNDPEFKEKFKEKFSDPEFKEKRRKKIQESLNDPEVRAKISENVKLSLSKITPERRKEIIRKAKETRRLRKLQQ